MQKSENICALNVEHSLRELFTAYWAFRITSFSPHGFCYAVEAHVSFAFWTDEVCALNALATQFTGLS